MAIPYYRFFPGDYARDTRHLSLTQHGVYRLLIDLYMDQGGPLRNDLPYLHRWLHAESVEERNAVEFILGEFFLLTPDGWTHGRADREISWRSEQSRAGKAAVEARERRKYIDRQSTDHRPFIDRSSNQNQNQNHIKVKSTVGINPDVLQILDFLNLKTGRRYRPVPANTKLITARLKEGATVNEMKQVVAKKCREWANDDVMAEYLRPATLFNATKFAQYQGELLAMEQNDGLS